MVCENEGNGGVQCECFCCVLERQVDELGDQHVTLDQCAPLFKLTMRHLIHLTRQMADIERVADQRDATLTRVHEHMSYALTVAIPAKFEKLDGRMDKLEGQVKKLELTVVGGPLKTADRFAELSRALLGVTEKVERVDRDLKRFLDICHARTDLLSSDEDDEQPTTSGSAASTGTA